MSSAKDLKARFAQAQPRAVVVDVPDVGPVTVRELTVGDLDSVDYENSADARAKNVALAIYTEDGKDRVFDPDDQNDLEIIKRLGARTLNKIIGAFEEKN